MTVPSERSDASQNLRYWKPPSAERLLFRVRYASVRGSSPMVTDHDTPPRTDPEERDHGAPSPPGTQVSSRSDPGAGTAMVICAAGSSAM